MMSQRKRESVSTGTYVKIGVSLVFWLVLLFLVARQFNHLPAIADWETAWETANSGSIAGFVILFVSSISIRALRWLVFLRQEVPFRFREIIPIFGWAFFVKTFTPLRAGEIIRAFWAQKRGCSLGFSLGSIVVERIFDMGVLVTIAALCLMFGANSLPETGTLIGAITVLGLVLVGFGIALLFADVLLSWSRRMVNSLGFGQVDRLAKFFAFADRVLEAFLLLRSSATLLKIVAGTLVIWGCVVYAYYILFLSFFPEIPFLAAAAFVACVNIAGFISMTPANVGSYEVAGVLALGAFGINGTLVLPVVILGHILMLAVSGVFGCLSRLALQRQLSGKLDLY